MTVGLPGTGIGGIFYLLSAFYMPFREIVKTFGGKSSVACWLAVLRQLSMGIIIVACMWLLGVVAAVVFDLFIAVKPSIPGVVQDMHTHLINTAFHINIFHVAPIIMSVVTLSAILTLTNILRIVVRPLAEEV